MRAFCGTRHAKDFWEFQNIEDARAYSACVTVLVRDRRYYILNVYRARLDYPSLKQQIVRHAQDFGGDRVRVLIEDKGSGSSLIQDLRYDTQVRPIAFEPEGDKVSRLVCQTAVIERGDVFLPEAASWLDAFRKEILQLPAGCGLSDRMLGFHLIWNARVDRKVPQRTRSDVAFL